ncbi:MAG TPA: hypothetical protein VEA80_01150 [Vitreimonas sp.]|nr:hypothetical protein [Vitreimonas sp.]
MLLVQAPAGYGKTVLLTHLFKAATGARAWLSITAANASFERLRDDVAAVLGGVCAFAPDLLAPPAAEGARLGEALARAGEPVLLAIDDYHLAASRDANAFMRALLAGARAPARIALAMRTAPRIGATALAAKGLVRTLHADVLAFTEAETLDFLAGGEEAATAAWRASEGWPAALALARSLIAAGASPQHAIAGASGPVGAFVAEETFDPLEEDLKRFLVDTALLSRLDAQSADAVREAGASALCLDRLERSGALVFADANAWRRHVLLDQFLAPRFAALPAPEQRKRRERAARVAAEREDWDQAFAIAASAGGSALAQLELRAPRLWSLSALGAAQSRLSAQDNPALAKAPTLAALRAAALFDAGAPREHIEAAFDCARAAFASSSERAEASTALVWRALERALRASPLGPEERASLLAAEVGEKALLWHIRAAHALLDAAFEEALDCAKQGLEAAQVEGALARELALATLAFVAFADGRLGAASEALEAAQALGGAQRRYRPARRAIAALIAAERGEAPVSYDLAGEDAPRLLAMSAPLACESTRLAARAACEASGFGQARTVLQSARAEAEAQGWAHARDMFDAEELTLALRARQTAPAGSLARRLQRRVGSDACPRFAWAALALARRRLACGAPREARALLGPLLAVGRPSRRVRARALVLDAAAAQALGQAGETASALARFLTEYGADVGAAPFFEDGAGLLEETCALAARLAPMQSGADALEAAAALAVARPRFTGEDALAAPDQRERAMFEALRKHGSRVEAARALELSENTLKFYLKRAFQKWRVNDWRLAAAVARRLSAGA